MTLAWGDSVTNCLLVCLPRILLTCLPNCYSSGCPHDHPGNNSLLAYIEPCIVMTLWRQQTSVTDLFSDNFTTSISQDCKNFKIVWNIFIWWWHCHTPCAMIIITKYQMDWFRICNSVSALTRIRRVPISASHEMLADWLQSLSRHADLSS